MRRPFRCSQLLLLILTWILASYHAQAKVSPEDQAIVIEQVNLVDAVEGLRKNMTIIIRDDRIVEVGKANKIKPPQTATRIDGRGKYLIPGLWDTHVHLTFSPEMEDSMLPLFLANGVTSVRDIGGQLEPLLAWREKSRNNLSTTVYIAGPLIDGSPIVYSGKLPGYPNISVNADTPEQAVQVVDQLAAAGVDLIKAYEMLKPETFKAIIRRARHHGLPVTGHVPLSMTAVEASAAGMRSMEHLRNLDMDCAKSSRQLYLKRQALLAQGKDKPGSALRSEIHSKQHYSAAQDYDLIHCQALAEQLAQNDTWQVPTLTLLMAFKHHFFLEDEWLHTFNHLPEPARSKWLAMAQKLEATINQSPETMAKRVAVSEGKLTILDLLNKAGVKIMAGTDTPILLLTPGFSLHKELETLVMAGLTPLQALESATLAPAKYFNLSETQGTIAPDMLADLVLLEANPLEDIRNTTQIDAVIKHGQLLNREALDRLLENTAEGRN